MEKSVGRIKRHRRVRKKVFGTTERPRLSVFRSNRHLYSQIIDDASGRTLVGLSSLNESIQGDQGKSNVTIDYARRLGTELGNLAVEKGIKRVVFDRGGYRYHGQVKALAEGAREAGLEF
jgi:large subunit ribosomal protein L18